MKNHSLLISFLVLSCVGFAQEKIAIKEYSYSEFFKMIEEEQDSVFKLSNALIHFDPQNDKRFIGTIENSKVTSYSKDTLVINKRIVLENTIFDSPSVRDSLNRQSFPTIHHTIFKEPVELKNSFGPFIYNCLFKSSFSISNNENFSTISAMVQNKLEDPFLYTILHSCVFESSMNYRNFPSIEDKTMYGFSLENSTLHDKVFISAREGYFESIKNKFKGKDWILIFPNATEVVRFQENKFEKAPVFLKFRKDEIPDLNFSNNLFNNHILLDLPAVKGNETIGWEQLRNKTIDFNSFTQTARTALDSIPELKNSDFRSLERRNYYLNNLRVERKDIFNEEIKFRARLHRFYKNQYKNEEANAVYMELKNLETARLKYIFDSNPSFDKYFKWKVNQFLKVFSDYGTEPSKAVTFSFYVVLFFAFIYLFFPNTWDSHGKRRIMDRYRFFLKYVNKNSGIHEVYLEEKKPELLASEEFKTYLLEKGKTAPKFFTTTALPLYRWSVASTKTFSWLLSKVDVLKGTWSETETHRKPLKAVLIFIAFFIAILYDVFIKILNALMLSINTFTTLGFGEIPIKGLPRYLAIIQGFIGWFMLTIFSVSLISQLLN